ncbi:MAG TPA: hypothetical protein VL460_08840 [Caulobacteraceae bacterium]|jgi:hypothetical protein|nr:hypothetical protein [Caulobacteraceae bacterium]
MRAKIVGGLVLAMGLTAAGCADNNRQANAKVCTPFAAAPAANAADPTAVSTAPGGEAAAFDDCLHRWGYKLAGSRDPAGDVAVAVMAACAPTLSHWNQSTLAAQPPGTTDAAMSLVTGKEGNTPADRYEMGQGKAQFYVVQARAGNCAPPPN